MPPPFPLVLVAGQDAIDTETDHLQEPVLSQDRVATVIEYLDKSAGQADAQIELADGSSPASPENWPGDGSITSGVPKKGRQCGLAAAMLMVNLSGKDKHLTSHQACTF